jgi:cell division protein ZapA
VLQTFNLVWSSVRKVGCSVKEKVEVTLLGQSFTVRSDKDEAYVHSLASFVTRRYEELQRQTRTVSSHDLALLVALNLADELFQSEDRAELCRKEVRERSIQILQNIDGTIAQMSREEALHEDSSHDPIMAIQPHLEPSAQ